MHFEVFSPFKKKGKPLIFDEKVTKTKQTPSGLHTTQAKPQAFWK